MVGSIKDVFLEEVFDTLNSSANNYTVWLREHLNINGSYSDPLDFYSLVIGSVSIKKNRQLMFLLPDRSDLRPSLLFSSLLTLTWFNSSQEKEKRKKVLYFGSTTRIRDQLKNARFDHKKIHLDEFFPQLQLTRKISELKGGSNGLDGIWDAYVPIVITSYSPFDPVTVIIQNEPDLIIADSGVEYNLGWLEQVVNYSQTHEIPLIAWTQNPLTENLTFFKIDKGLVYYWPYLYDRDLEKKLNQGKWKMEDYFKLPTPSNILPIVIHSEGNQNLMDAYQELWRAQKLSNGSLTKDAIIVGWRYLRSMESLPINLDLYESEVGAFWGLNKILDLRSAFSKFVEEIEKQETLKEINECFTRAHDYLESYYNFISNNEPPLWQGLLSLIENSNTKDHFNVIIFTSEARKKLFLYGLLSNRNITEDDLYIKGILLMSLNSVRQILDSVISGAESEEESTPPLQKIREGGNLEYIFIGLPGPHLTPKLDTLLIQDNISFLIYDYQEKTMKNLVTALNKKMTVDFRSNFSILNQLFSAKDFDENKSDFEINRLNMSHRKDIYARETQTQKHEYGGELFPAVDPVLEMESLMKFDDDSDDYSIFLNANENNAETKNTEKYLYITEAIRVTFNDNWECLFGTNDMVNVLMDTSKGRKLDHRFARSLRKGEKVLFVHGDNKRSLYELIISRLNDQRGIRLHVELVERWHRDFRQHFVDKMGKLTEESFTNLLQGIIRRGSKITSTQTLNSWFQGYVLAPLDREDLRRLAEELDMKFVSSHYKRIYTSAERLRNIHRSLSSKLQRWLVEQSVGIIDNKNERSDIIDQDLGLTMQDFRDSLIVLHVESLTEESDLIYSNRVGRIYRRGI